MSWLGPAAAATLLMLSLALWRQRPRPAAALSLAVCMMSGAAFFLFQSGMAWLYPFTLLGPLAFNRAMLAAFGERRHPAWLDALLAALCVAAGELWPALFDALALLVFAEAPLRIAMGLRDDLNARRRVGRTWFLALGSLLCVLTSAAALAGQGRWAVPAAAACTLLLCLAMAGRRVPVEEASSAEAVPTASAPEALNDQELRQLARLREQMQLRQAFRDPRLSLSVLARRLELPEHRLRRLIHIGEGCDHFSAYLNGLRLAAIKQALADPAQDGQTLLSLAVDAGYNSLSAFNRAFKSAEGCTPSAFRAARRAMATASSAKPIETASET